MNAGKAERYFPKSKKAVLVLVAAPDAPLTTLPQRVRVVVRPIVEGKVSQPVASEVVPVMVVANFLDEPAKTVAPAAGKP
jgi:hypothetical protein